jgi:hypothetical protein
MRTGAGFPVTERSQKAYRCLFKVGVMVLGLLDDPEDRIGRIRDLCARVVATQDPDEINKITSQLRAELEDQITRLRGMVDTYRSRANGGRGGRSGENTACCPESPGSAVR